MGFLSLYDEKAHIELQDKYYVDVQVFLPSDASEEAKRRMLTVGVKAVDGAAQEVTTKFDNGAYKLELAAQMVIGWNLTDEDDVLLPFETLEQRRASVKRLPSGVLDKIIAEYKEDLAKPDEEVATFPSGSEESHPEG